MDLELTEAQKEMREEFARFVQDHVVPQAARIEHDETLTSSIIELLAARGYLGACVPARGRRFDPITYGLLHEQIGRVSGSIRSIVTVQDMVSTALFRCGSPKQKAKWLPRLVSGEVLAGFALTEPDAGSDVSSIQTTAKSVGDEFVINGTKRWITGGQIAGMFLVFARYGHSTAAFLIERSSPGLSIVPITGMLGLRGSMLAELRLTDCRIPADNLVGNPSLGFATIGACALDHGRYSMAWGCAGMALACLDKCLEYTARRKQFSTFLKNQQSIQRMIADMEVQVAAARLLCWQAGRLKVLEDPGAVMATNIAKYYASVVAARIATDAVQLHGAAGCLDDTDVARHFRDAKIMEIIEGSIQIQQMLIAQYAYRRCRTGWGETACTK